MLNENIKILRMAKGLSQEELATKLNVVRQTISKWEQGRSVPDADMLIALSDALGEPVSRLLGETVAEPKPDDMRALSEKLEVVNLQLVRAREARRRRRRWTFIVICAVVIAVFLGLFFWGSPYLGWDYGDPETAVAGTALHAFEFAFVRVAPLVLIGSFAGIYITRKER